MDNIVNKIVKVIKEARKKIDPKLKAWIADKYGPWNENDFLSDDGDTYFKTSDVNKETGSVEHTIINLPSFGELIKSLKLTKDAANKLIRGESVRDDEVIRDIAKELKLEFNKFRTHLRKEYPAFYAQLKGQLTEEELDEMSTTGGGAGSATFTAGTGMQYATPYAFNKNKKAKGTDDDIYTKEFGYKLVKENLKDYIKISEPRFKKDKNNPNFLNVFMDYDTGGGGALMALGKETMSGQIRRLSSAEAVRQMNDIAKKLNDSFNVEDIEVTDLENGKVRIFAVSDDFIDMDPRSELSMALLDENIGATLGPGPKASADGVKDNSYVKEFGYKLVPKKIKGSGLIVKQLFEAAESTDDFQGGRLKAFDRIEQEINDIYKMLSNAKNETAEYYKENPGSYSVVKPTDLVLDYIKDIKDLLKGE